MTRFPPNIEQLSVKRESTVVWLIARRNDIELRFPLKEEDCAHLAALLLGYEPHDFIIDLKRQHKEQAGRDSVSSGRNNFNFIGSLHLRGFALDN